MFSIQSDARNGNVYYSLRYSSNGSRKRLCSLGNEKSLKNGIPDPCGYLRTIIDQVNMELNEGPPDPVPMKKGGEVRNMGCFYIKMALRDLGIYDLLVREKKRHREAVHSFMEIFTFLVFSRIIDPGSIASEYRRSGLYPGNIRFGQDTVYQYLDYFYDCLGKMKETLYENAPGPMKDRKEQLLLYDGTNFWIFSGHPDEDVRDKDGNVLEKALVTFGFSKENRFNYPLVSIGLFASEFGYPIDWNVFPGKEKEVNNIIPELARMKEDWGIGSYEYEADRANGSGSVIAWIQRVNGEDRKKREYTEDDETDRYIISKSIRQGSDSLKKFALDPGGYEDYRITDPDGNVRTYRLKSRTVTQPVYFTTSNGKKRKVTVRQIQIVYYSEPYAQREKHIRKRKLEQSADMIESPAMLHSKMKSGSLKFVNIVTVDSSGNRKAALVQAEIDTERVRREEQYDGLYAIVSNEFGESIPLIVWKQKLLSFDERDFRILKSFLKLRPAYVRTKKHIIVHVAICMVSLIILRYLEYVVKNRFTPEQIQEGLQDYFAIQIDTRYRIQYRNRVIEALEEGTGLSINKRIMSLNEMKHLFRWDRFSTQLQLFEL